MGSRFDAEQSSTKKQAQQFSNFEDFQMCQKIVQVFEKLQIQDCWMELNESRFAWWQKDLAQLRLSGIFHQQRNKFGFTKILSL